MNKFNRINALTWKIIVSTEQEENRIIGSEISDRYVLRTLCPYRSVKCIFEEHKLCIEIEMRNCTI